MTPPSPPAPPQPPAPSRQRPRAARPNALPAALPNTRHSALSPALPSAPRAASSPAPPFLLLATLLAASLLAATPALARDSLGTFGTWAAFRDPGVPRCYAIAMPTPASTTPASATPTSATPASTTAAAPASYQPYAAIGTWPRRGIHGALHLRLSRQLSPNTTISLMLAGPSGTRRLRLVGGGNDAWPANRQDDAAIAALLRSASTLSISSRDTTGHAFTDSYPLTGAATALDAAAIGCAGLK